MALAMPVSSSRLRNMNPFAVPGRWRQITHPATLTRRPCFSYCRSSAATTPRVRKPSRYNFMGCGPMVTPVPKKSARMRSGAVMAFRGDGGSAASTDSNNGPAGRNARSASHNASRRFPPIEFNAPTSASIRSSGLRKPSTRRTTSLMEEKGRTHRAETIASAVSLRTPRT